MIFDRQTLFSDAQAVTADAASTNVIDLGPIATGIIRNVGKGKRIPLVIQVVEDFNTLTSLEVKVETDSADSFASPKVVATTGAIALADLKKGKRFSIDFIPRDTDERFVRLYYDVTGTAPTLGRITAGVALGAD